MFNSNMRSTVREEGGSNGGRWDRSWRQLVPGRKLSPLAALEVLALGIEKPRSLQGLKNRRRCVLPLESIRTMPSPLKSSFPSRFGSLGLASSLISFLASPICLSPLVLSQLSVLPGANTQSWLGRVPFKPVGRNTGIMMKNSGFQFFSSQAY